MKLEFENTSTKTEHQKLEKSLGNLATKHQIYELREDMSTKIERKEIEVVLYEGEKNMKVAAKLPTREEIIERLGHH